MFEKTIIVTGGAGFIGSRLIERLLNEGNRVICVDNLMTGSRQNIERFFSNKKFEFFEHDIVEPFDIPGHIHEIYNLACAASPIKYQEDPVHTIKTNTIGILNILDCAKEKNATILQASTSEVYGDPEVHPQHESYKGNVNPIGPRACYDEGKRCAETLFFEYHRSFGVKIKVVRIFNTYGPGMAFDDGRVVSNFIWSALHNKPLTVYGDGTQTRSFCYVDDMVDGLIRMMKSPAKIVGPINLGNPGEFTVQELAEKIQTLCGGKSKIVYKDLPEDDPKQRKPDIATAQSKLKWTPAVALDEGLIKTVDYFKTVV